MGDFRPAGGKLAHKNHQSGTMEGKFGDLPPVLPGKAGPDLLVGALFPKNGLVRQFSELFDDKVGKKDLFYYPTTSHLHASRSPID